MRMTIEKALEWAYREELPREQVEINAGARAPALANASAPMAGFLENPSAAIDVPINRWGVVGVRDMFGRGLHADAVQIGLAVDALCSGAVALAADAVPRPASVQADHATLWDDAVARAASRLPRRLKDVIVRRALAGDPAHWQGDGVQVVPVLDQFGNQRWFRTVTREAKTWRGQAMGADERLEVIVNVAREPGRRPRAGDYRKFRLEPDPVWVIEARAVYAAWRAALDVLFEDLAPRLHAVILLPSEAAQCPWGEEVV